MTPSLNKNIPKLRFPDFKGEWEIKNLSEVTQRVTTKNTIGIKNVLTISAQFGLISQLEFFNKSVSAKDVSGYYLLSKNDFAYNKSYSNGYPMGAIKRLNRYENGVVSTLYICFRNNEGLDNSFAEQYFETGNQNYEIEKVAQEGARNHGLLNIGVNDFFAIKIIVPSLPEQTKIASFLSSVDKKLSQLKQKKNLLEQYKKGVMQKLFSQEFRFKDENGKEFPNWEEKKLGEIGAFQTSSIDKLSKVNEKEVFLVNYMNVYRHENVNNETIKSFQVVTAKDHQIESCNLKKGDILFTPSSETPDDIGHSVVIFEDLENAVFSYHLMRFRPNIKIDILYSHYFCNISSVLKQLTKLATGSTRFTISVRSFSSVEISLPCLKEQTKIANFLSSIDKKINHCQLQIEKTENWKKGLLQQLFV
jgi:type I restriction enzyme S subunit